MILFSVSTKGLFNITNDYFFSFLVASSKYNQLTQVMKIFRISNNIRLLHHFHVLHGIVQPG
jgi:hypothetical protein